MTNPSRVLIDGSKFGLDWLKVYWYGALIVLGIILAFILCSHEAKRRNFHKDCVIDICLIVVPLGAIFARIYYIVFALDSFIKPGMSFGQILLGMINVRDGGLAIYGAIIGGILGMVIYARHKKMHVLSVIDLVMPSVALAQAIGRWGNFFNQEAYGTVISKNFPPYFPIAVKIDECTQSCCADLPSRLGNIHYATFFYESVWCFIIFLVLWFIIRKKAKHRGDVTLVYLAMYGFERAFVEQLRTDSLMLGNIRVSQLLSAVLCVAAVALLIIRAVLEKKQGRRIMPVEEVYYGEKPDEKANKKDDGWTDIEEPSEEQPEEASEEPEGNGKESEENGEVTAVKPEEAEADEASVQEEADEENNEADNEEV